jgi:lipopolysaccharide transport system permease protein
MVITKVYFPRLILPLSSVKSGLVDFGIAFAVLLALATALGVGLWLSALNALYRDVQYVMPFLVQFWMLASPVAYRAAWCRRLLYGLNPMAGVIEGFRWALTGHGHAPGALLVASAAMVAVLLVGGILFFQRMEGTVTDLV